MDRDLPSHMLPSATHSGSISYRAPGAKRAMRRSSRSRHSSGTGASGTLMVLSTRVPGMGRW